MYGSSDDMEMMEVNTSDVTTSGMGQDIGRGQMMVMKVNSTNVTVLISGLDPFTNYTFYVLAVTIAPSEPSDSVTVLTDEAGMKSSIFH